MKGFFHAVAFLTRVPMPRYPSEAREQARSVPWFPVVGALVGAAAGGMYALLASRLPTLAAATIAVAVGMILTGAFHEDGLADAVDGIAGGRTPDERLRIMKDSRHGTFGVLALATVLIVRVSCVGALDAWSAVSALIAANALGRSAALVLMRSPAAGEGLGATYTAAVRPVHIVIGSIVGVGLAVAFAGWVALVAVPAAAIGALVVGAWARRAVGGVTGDVLGAAEQVAELVVLAGLTGWATAGHPLAWWK